MTKKTIKAGSLCLISLIILLVLAFYIVLPQVYTGYLERQGIPVYPDSKIRYVRLTGTNNYVAMDYVGKIVGVFSFIVDKDKAFILESNSSYSIVSEFYKERLINQARSRELFKEGTDGAMQIKIGEKITIAICDRDRDRCSDSSYLTIRIFDPNGKFSSDKLDLWRF